LTRGRPGRVWLRAQARAAALIDAVTHLIELEAAQSARD
jgi:hypothetical protein